MGYIAYFARLVIIFSGIFIAVKNFIQFNTSFLVGLLFILIGLYLSFFAVYGPEATKCPFLKDYKGKK